MKKVFCLTTTLILLLSVSIAEIDIATPTTDKHLSLFNIPWGISVDEFKLKISSVYSSQCDIDGYSFYSDPVYSSFSFSDSGDFISSSFAPIVSFPKFCKFDKYCLMGGHVIDKITAYFYTYDRSDYLYEASVEFKLLTENLYEIDVHDQYKDLQIKLTQLYGTPYTCQGHFESKLITLSDFDWEESVWISSDNTGAILRKEYNHSKPDDWRENENVTLQYGDISSAYEFERINKEVENKKKLERESSLNMISNSFDGL